jgi:hypothetical protein
VIRDEDGYSQTKYFFVSKHAAEQLALKCNDKRKFFVESYAKAAAAQNPAYRGWIFEATSCTRRVKRKSSCR